MLVEAFCTSRPSSRVSTAGAEGLQSCLAQFLAEQQPFLIRSSNASVGPFPYRESCIIFKECVKNKNQLVSGEACWAQGGVVAVKSDSPPWLVHFLGTRVLWSL